MGAMASAVWWPEEFCRRLALKGAGHELHRRDWDAIIRAVEHQMKPYRVEYEAKLPALLQRPREAAVLTPLGEWRRSGE